MPRLLLVIACLALAALCGSRAQSAAPAAAQSRGAGQALGGFSAIAIQGLWIRADRALQDRREDEALLYLRAINDLAPHVVSAARYTAFEIGANLAEGRADPAVRWSLVHEGLRVLDRAVEQNPRSADARANRAHFLTVRVLHPDAAANAAAYRRDVDAHGAERAARIDLEEAVRLAPQDPFHRASLAGMFSAEAERDAGEGRLRDAAEHFAGAVAAYDGLIALFEEHGAERFAAEIDDARSARDANARFRAEAVRRLAHGR